MDIKSEDNNLPLYEIMIKIACDPKGMGKMPMTTDEEVAQLDLLDLAFDELGVACREIDYHMQDNEIEDKYQELLAKYDK